MISKAFVRKVRTYVVVYIVLFVFIGPKLFLIEAMIENKKGAMVHDQIYSLAWGRYTNDAVKICFQGRVRGVVGEFQYENSLGILDAEDSTPFLSVGIKSKYVMPGCKDRQTTGNMKELLLDRSKGNSELSQQDALLAELADGNAVLILYSLLGNREKRNRTSFSVVIPSTDRDRTYHFILMGKIYQKSDHPFLMIFGAILKDLMTWPYQWLLLILH